VPDGQRQQVLGCSQPLVIGALAWQVGEQVAEPGVREPKPAPLGCKAEEDLGDRQADQLGIAELGAAAGAKPWAKQVVDGDVQCGDEVVETGVHGASLEVDVAKATPTLGDLVLSVTGRPLHQQSESMRASVMLRRAMTVTGTRP
jgi:hypothetical protein